ncbi:MAG: DUF2892 domain-containing protein [Nanohaloarchaea archaeon SW_7_46_7]|nr:MAG: DUF2892 domain-containing protein [Nanohaloarchaea archaeon SW_7_46_7]
MSDRESKIRVSLGAFLVFLGSLGQSGTLPLANILAPALTSVTLTVIGLVLVIEGYYSRCLLYRVLGINRKD